ncbi:hypothetical protein NHX12_034363 [Muraenolepis orangiensis]|uniref:Uncharacterized protein n=1 Tax=Muraenolepis orangiensis TaxID=630683 RepID=A0A9Q0D5G9_9TELE|nr:hypothetical protein NHX12_034363 [Muraenolepis orangiensis]
MLRRDSCLEGPAAERGVAGMSRRERGLEVGIVTPKPPDPSGSGSRMTASTTRSTDEQRVTVRFTPPLVWLNAHCNKAQRLEWEREENEDREEKSEKLEGGASGG